jgi:hypothetical protein
MKEIVSNESQSGYVMANTRNQHGITFLLPKENQEAMEMRPKIHSSSSTSSSCSFADPKTSTSLRMKSFKSPVRQLSPEEQLDHQTTMKLVVVRLVSNSTTCSCINDDHLVPQSTEESAF